MFPRSSIRNIKEPEINLGLVAYCTQKESYQKRNRWWWWHKRSGRFVTGGDACINGCRGVVTQTGGCERERERERERNGYPQTMV